MTKRRRIKFSSIPALVLLFFPVMSVQAAEVDFSCMSYRVWSKDHLSSSYRDNDIVLQNHCPGAVYWSMCIERVDPWTSEILETHNPTGYVNAEKKTRVNLHLQKSKNRTQFRNRFQEFYVSFGFGIDKPVMASCVARQCEDKKRGLREQVRTNEKAWERAQKSLRAQIADECPDAGWDAKTREECAARIQETSHSDSNAFALKDKELREKMAEIDSERCQVFSGELSGG